MADFFTPIRVSDDLFGRALQFLEEAASRRVATLASRKDAPLRWVEITDAAVVEDEFPHLQWSSDEQLREVVNWLDFLLAFAFDDAPDSTVASWAATYDPDLEDRAIKRVRHLAANLPGLKAIWESKTRSMVPPLHSPTRGVLYDMESGLIHVDFKFAASISTPQGRVATGDEVTVRLLAPDLALLRDEIDDVLEEMTFYESVDDEEDGPVAEGDSK